MANRIPRGRRAQTGADQSSRRKRRTPEIIGEAQPPPSVLKRIRRSASRSTATSETTGSTPGSESAESESREASFAYSNPRKIGRPTKIHDVLIRQRKLKDGTIESYEITVADAILEVVRLGNYKDTAARFAGINDSTLFRWIEWGDPEGSDPERQVYRDFRAALEKTEAESEARHIGLILDAAQKGGPGAWQAAAWLRERMDPGRYGKREHIVVRQEMAVQIASDVLELTRLALERHVSDAEQRRSVLKDIIAGGLAVADRVGGSVQADRAQGPS